MIIASVARGAGRQRTSLERDGIKRSKAAARPGLVAGPSQDFEANFEGEGFRITAWSVAWSNRGFTVNPRAKNQAAELS